jgi:histidine triad (HIT) family protein
MSCIFCKIIEGKSNAYKVYEDELTMAFLDINPISSGHTLIVPKLHKTKLENLPDKHSIALFKTVRKLIGPIQKAMSTPSANIGINNGREAGQIIPHIHVHVIPRDGSKPTWRGEKKKASPKSKEYFEEIARKIQEEI